MIIVHDDVYGLLLFIDAFFIDTLTAVYKFVGTCLQDKLYVIIFWDIGRLKIAGFPS